jgi:hypothetical protein
VLHQPQPFLMTQMGIGLKLKLILLTMVSISLLAAAQGFEEDLPILTKLTF